MSRLSSHAFRVSNVAHSVGLLSRRVAGGVCARLRVDARASGRALSQGFRLLLVTSLLATSTPAAPAVLSDAAASLRSDLSYWYKARALAFINKELMLMQGGGQRRAAQERQQDRDARVRRVRVFPGDVTVHVDEHVVLAAVAYDQSDSPIGGARVSWSARDEGRAHAAFISRRGDFEAVAPGTYKITAQIGNKQDQVRVTVLDGSPHRRDEQPLRSFPASSRTVPPGEAASANKKSPSRPGPRRAARSASGASLNHVAAGASAATMLPGDCDDVYRWNQCTGWRATDPDNRRGTPPGGSPDQAVGSGNFQASAPVLSLPGRGLDLSLALVYNSHVWSKTGTSQMTFDADQDWPAPGWSLGFGKMVNMGMDNVSMLVDADGTRHPSIGTVTPYSSGYRTFDGHTTDGTFITHTHAGNTTNGLQSGWAYMPNGTTIQYGAPGQNAIYPVSIVDANGNFISITYVGGHGPRIQSVSDTLGRTVSFSYDPTYNLLTAITGPGLDGTTRTLVRLNYRQVPLSPSFPGMTTVVRDWNPWVLNAVYYPANGTGFWLGDGDSYLAGYGMIQKLSEQRAMGFSAASLNDPGTVTQGTMSQQDVYTYLLTNLTDAPTITSASKTWDGMTAAPSVMSYESYPNATPRKVIVTLPNGTKSTQYSYNHPPVNGQAQYDDGLVYLDETRDSGGALLKSSQTVWEKGAFDSPRPLSVTVTDERGQTTGAEFGYSGSYNQVTEARNYDYGYAYQGGGNVLLSKTVTEYEAAQGYASRHIYNLVHAVSVYGSDGTRASFTQFQYDGASAPDTPNGGATLANLPTEVAQHDDAYNPYAPEYLVSQCDEWDPYYVNCLHYNEYWTTNYQPATDYRGNVTQITRYSNAAPDPAAGAITETRQYDITGNVVKATSWCQQATFTYTSDTQYAYPQSQKRGSPTDPTAQLTSAATYDFDTGLALSATDANGLTSYTSYYSDTLHPHVQSVPSGAHTDFDYDETNMSVTSTTYLAAAPVDTGAVADENIKLLNGVGLVRQEKALGANGAWDLVDTEYDTSGQVSRQTRPYRAGETPQWSTSEYDALGRVVKGQAPDGTTPQAGSATRTFYNEAARPGAATPNAPGETIRTVDAWGRERWARFDSSGKLVEVVEPDPNGDGTVTNNGMRTNYTYDTLGNLTLITQGDQTRSFKYDSLGRLTRQKLAEQTATLNDAGGYVGAGGPGALWGEAFSYDDGSNLVGRTDARGVRTTRSYDRNGGPDPLGRVQSISYDLTGPHENLASSAINAAATATYSYEQSGDVTRLSGVAAGISSESYDTNSDPQRRLSGVTININGRAPYYINYTYDSLDRAKSVRYPNEYGLAAAPRKLVEHTYDAASRLTGLQVDSVSYASELAYNAASQTTTLKVGPANAYQTTENYNYDPKTGLLQHQDVYHATQGTVLNLDYSYLRDGTADGRAGELTKISDNINHNKDRGFEYDALGRLKRATGGGAAGAWAQSYFYDRYGNRPRVRSERTSDFVTRLYQSALVRNPNSSELQTGDAALRQSYAQGQAQLSASAKQSAAGVFDSAEYAARQRSDRDYVYDLYRAYLNREPDQGGWDSWTAAVATSGRPAVRQGFADSTEFAERVSGLYPGLTGGNSGVAAPTNLSVASSGDTQVRLSWTASAGAVDHYQVERRQSGSSSYTSLANTTTPEFTDTSVSTDAAYLYRVRAVAAGGAASSYSNLALGTAVTFTDDPIQAGATQVMANHLRQLRRAVNGVRRLAGLPDAVWSEAVDPGVLIRAPHVRELRDRLDEALTALALPAGTYTDVGLPAGTAIKKDHFEELRRQSARLSSAVSGGGSTSAGAAVEADGWGGLSVDSATNRINSAGWEYDAAGDLTRGLSPATGAWQRYEYDAAGRLTRVKDDSGTALSTYGYGPTNERVMAEEGGARTYYVGTVAEYVEYGASTTPQWSKSYVYLGGRLLATLAPGGNGELVQYQHPDRLGTRLVSDGADAGYFEQSALPYGTALGSESTGATNRRFTSYDRSGVSGLDYAVNRQYDPQQGRFTQADPLGLKSSSLTNPQSLNLYAYCAGDPINHTDPDGLFSLRGLLRGIGKFFRGVGRALSAVGNAIATVLNNRWVRIGVFIASFLLPGIGLLSSTLARVIGFGIKIYNYVADIGAQLQLFGQLLQGKFKDLAINLGLSVLGAAISEVVDPIVTGVQNAIFKGDLSYIPLGIMEGIGKLNENLFDRVLTDVFVPFYGIYGGPGNPPDDEFDDEKEEFKSDTPGVDDTDNNGYKQHDLEGRKAKAEYKKGNIKKDEFRNRVRLSDRHLVGHLLVNAPSLHLLDIAFAGQFGGRPGIGSGYKFFALNFFSARYAYRTITR